RQQNFYPPFARLIEITFKHTDKKIVREFADATTNELKAKLKGVKILGPGEPMVSKIRNEFLLHILLKVPRDQGHLAEVKKLIAETSSHVSLEKLYRSVKVVFDVDPV